MKAGIWLVEPAVGIPSRGRTIGAYNRDRGLRHVYPDAPLLPATNLLPDHRSGESWASEAPQIKGDRPTTRCATIGLSDPALLVRDSRNRAHPPANGSPLAPAFEPWRGVDLSVSTWCAPAARRDRYKTSGGLHRTGSGMGGAVRGHAIGPPPPRGLQQHRWVDRWSACSPRCRPKGSLLGHRLGLHHHASRRCRRPLPTVDFRPESTRVRYRLDRHNA